MYSVFTQEDAFHENYEEFMPLSHFSQTVDEPHVTGSV